MKAIIFIYSLSKLKFFFSLQLILHIMEIDSQYYFYHAIMPVYEQKNVIILIYTYIVTFS